MIVKQLSTALFIIQDFGELYKLHCDRKKNQIKSLKSVFILTF